MAEYKLGEIEKKFAKIIWEQEPIPSGELAKICEKELKWKKSTTYTILKRLCERELFINENGAVRSLVSEKEFQANISEQFVEEAFSGSLPRFVAAFTDKRKLSEQEIQELQEIIKNGSLSGR